MNNLYYPVYKQIEKEILDLSTCIFFSDDQLNVYSLKLAELILRCSVEIESLAKDIYRKNVSKEPKNPGSCFEWMENNWHISKKEVCIVSPYFHIESLKRLKPFDYKNNSHEDYYSSYCAIKHDREKNIAKANLNTLIRSLAALYILNIYFVGERYYLDKDDHASKLDKSAGSGIFVFSVAPCTDNTLLTSEESIVPENCIYKITRKESEYAFKITYQNVYDETKVVHSTVGRKEFQDELSKLSNKSVDEELMWNIEAKYSEYDTNILRRQFLIRNKVSKILFIYVEKMRASFWAELNI